MKNSIQFAAIAAFASLLVAPAVFAQSTPKFAYINSQKIMQEAPGRAEAEATYDKEMGQARAQYQKMDDSLKTLMSSFEKDAPTLDSTQQAARAQVIRDRQTEFQKTAQDLQEHMQNRQAELIRPLMEQVSKVLDEIRARDHYAMIFDVGAQGSPVVSADSSLDITDQVVARLKQLGPPKASASSSATPSSSPTPSGPTRKPAGISH
jgi:outer membrane protein